MNKKPLIGISCNTLLFERGQVDPVCAAKGQDFFGVATDYVRMVEAAGGSAAILPSVGGLYAADAAAREEAQSCAEALWERLDGFLISGGNDVAPHLYGERVKKECGSVDTLRDAYETAAIKYALAHGKPLLCICRGMQLLNVALGGTLCQDLIAAGFEQHSLGVFRRGEVSHTVEVAPGSLLASIVGAGELGVNSFHHQAIARLADSLREAARSADGVIEAVEPAEAAGGFVLGVQWHPEMMAAGGGNSVQQSIASAFVSACVSGF